MGLAIQRGETVLVSLLHLRREDGRTTKQTRKMPMRLRNPQTKCPSRWPIKRFKEQIPTFSHLIPAAVLFKPPTKDGDRRSKRSAGPWGRPVYVTSSVSFMCNCRAEEDANPPRPGQTRVPGAGCGEARCVFKWKLVFLCVDEGGDLHA